MTRSRPSVDIRRFPQRRRAVLAALRAGRRRAPIHALIEVDVTEARRMLTGTGSSLTSFVIACVGRAAAADPEVHAYRDWRGRLVLHRHVGVATMVETETPDGPVPYAHVISDSDTRSVASIGEEIRRVKGDPEESWSGRMLARFGATRLPGSVIMAIFYRALEHSVRLRSLTGTVAVTSVGMYGDGGGFGITYPTVLTLTVLIGGLSEKPVVVDGEVAVREMLDLTITADHKVVDGAPFARFVNGLRALMEKPEALT